MSSKIVSLVGVTDSGDLISVGVGRDATTAGLLTLRKEIQAANGTWRKGNREIKLNELFLLGNHTSGGEVKARLKFR